MDVSRLNEWSREAIEAEARRIGVRAPDRLSHRELIDRIRAHHAKPLRRARRAFGKVMRFARSLTREPALEADVEPRASERRTSETPTSSSARETAPSESRPEEHPTRSSAEVGGSSRAATPATTSGAKLAAPTDAELVEIDAAIAEEPIPTRTMARLLAGQGHGRRAAAIYRKLMHQAPHDEELAHEAAQVQGRDARGSRTSPTPSASDDDDDADEVVLAPAPHGRVVVAWHVGESAAARARKLLGGVGRTRTRVVIVRPSSEGGIVRDIYEEDATLEGESIVSAPQGARVTAAVGLERRGRFVSMAHAPVLRV